MASSQYFFEKLSGPWLSNELLQNIVVVFACSVVLSRLLPLLVFRSSSKSKSNGIQDGLINMEYVFNENDQEKVQKRLEASKVHVAKILIHPIKVGRYYPLV